jgi:hypothetical protein
MHGTYNIKHMGLSILMEFIPSCCAVKDNSNTDGNIQITTVAHEHNLFANYDVPFHFRDATVVNTEI